MRAKILTLLLDQNNDIRLQYIKIAEEVLKKEPKETSHIVSSLFKNGVEYTETAEAYVRLLIKHGEKLEGKILAGLVKATGEYMMKNCCIGGTEGAKCIT